jgi:hypothetical protein
VDFNRLFSICVALGYLGLAYFAYGWELVWRVGIFLVLPMACIWFGDEMGSYTGLTGRGAITGTTPGWLVAAGGWLLLLLPIVVTAIGYWHRP